MAQAVEEGGDYGGLATDSLTQSCFLLRRCAPLEGEAAAAEAASRGAPGPHAMLTRHGHGGGAGFSAPPSVGAGPSPAPGGGGGVAIDGLPLSESGSSCTMPRGVRGEPAECGQARYNAFVRCAGATDGNAAAVLADANAAPFAKLHRFVVEAAAEGGGPPGGGGAAGAFGVNVTGKGGAAQLPAALVLAGGVNAADHAETFTQLAAHLRSAGCHAALLRSGDVGARAAGAPPPPGLCATLRVALAQLAGGEPPEAPTLRHLAAWYAAAPAPRAAGEACDDDDDSESVHGDGDGAADAQRRRHGHAQGRRRSSLGACAARRVPIALLVEDTECCAGDALADLLVALSEAGTALPVVLLLGVATSTTMLQALLPARAAARLRPRAFHLWPPVARLEALQRGVLLKPGTAPLLGAAPAALLHERFLKHDFSCSGVRAALRAAALLHFAHQPLAALAEPARIVHAADAAWAAAAAAAAECGVRDSLGRDEYRTKEREAAAAAAAAAQALRAACGALHPTLLLYARSNVAALRSHGGAGGPCAPQDGASRLAAALRAFGPAAAAWAAALQCVADAAEATSAAAAGALGLRELYRDASAPGFVAGEGAGALRTLRQRVSRLPDEALCDLVRRWVTHLRAVRWAGAGNEPAAAAAASTSADPGGAAPYDDMRRRAARVVQALRRKMEERARAEAAEADAQRMPPPPPPPLLQLQQAPAASPGRATPRRASGAGMAGAALAPPFSAGGAIGITPGMAGLASGPGGRGGTLDRRAMKSLLSARVAAAPPGSAGGGGSGRATAGGASGARPECDARRRALELFADLCDGPLAAPPQALPGAEVLLFADDKGLLAGYLQAAPRPTLEAALLRPGHADFLRCACCPAAPGAPPCSSMPDAGAAYALLCATGTEFVNVHDWFQDFVALHTRETGGAGGQQPGSRKRPRADRDKGGAAEKATAAVAKERLWALQARFTRALAELQTLGFIRPAKRKRGEHVQRLVWGAAESL